MGMHRAAPVTAPGSRTAPRFDCGINPSAAPPLHEQAGVRRHENPWWFGFQDWSQGRLRTPAYSGEPHFPSWAGIIDLQCCKIGL
jgi:hypothetical protein